MRQRSIIPFALACALILPSGADAGSKAAKAYNKYRNAIDDGDTHRELLRFLPKESAEWLGELTAKQLQQWFDRDTGDQRGIDHIEVKGDQRSDEGRALEVEGRRKADGKKGMAKVRMIEEDGAWKVASEDWDFAWDVRFEPTGDRDVARADHARGSLTVGDQRVDLSHAYVSLQPDVFDPDHPALSLLLSDIELHPSQFYQLHEMVERGEAHYIELTILRDQTVTTAMVNHNGLEGHALSMAGGIDCKATQFGPAVIAGRVSVSSDRTDFGDGIGFDVEFRSTLWGINGESLAKGGSATLDPQTAVGAFQLDGTSTTLAHAYARRIEGDEGEEVEILLTAKPVTAELLGQVDRLGDLLDHVAPALTFRVDTDDTASSWRWVVGEFSSGCVYCSDMMVNIEGRTGDAVHATAYVPRPKRHDGHDYEFKVSFHASLRPTTAAATAAATADSPSSVEEWKTLMRETMEGIDKK